MKVQCKNFKNEQQIHLAHTQIIQCLESRGLVYISILYLLSILTHTLHLSHLGYFFHQAHLTVNYYAFQLQTRRHYEFGGGISESWWATSLDFLFFFLFSCSLYLASEGTYGVIWNCVLQGIKSLHFCEKLTIFTTWLSCSYWVTSLDKIFSIENFLLKLLHCWDLLLGLLLFQIFRSNCRHHKTLGLCLVF